MKRISYSLLILCIFLSARTIGPARTMRLLQKFGAALKQVLGQRFFSSTADSLVGEVTTAYQMLPVPIRCLEQSIVLWYLLNLHGNEATMKIGVQLYPMTGHAWVEHQGQVFVFSRFIPDLKVVATYHPWRMNDASAS